MNSVSHCPRRGSDDVIHVPDTAHRHLANSLRITRFGWVRRFLWTAM